MADKKKPGKKTFEKDRKQMIDKLESLIDDEVSATQGSSMDIEIQGETKKVKKKYHTGASPLTAITFKARDEQDGTDELETISARSANIRRGEPRSIWAILIPIIIVVLLAGAAAAAYFFFI